MKNINISKRDLKFFFLGLFVFLVIDLIWSWPDAKRGFIDGLNNGYPISTKK